MLGEVVVHLVVVIVDLREVIHDFVDFCENSVQKLADFLETGWNRLVKHLNFTIVGVGSLSVVSQFIGDGYDNLSTLILYGLHVFGCL